MNNQLVSPFKIKKLYFFNSHAEQRTFIVKQHFQWATFTWVYNWTNMISCINSLCNFAWAASILACIIVMQQVHDCPQFQLFYMCIIGVKLKAQGTDFPCHLTLYDPQRQIMRTDFMILAKISKLLIVFNFNNTAILQSCVCY